VHPILAHPGRLGVYLLTWLPVAGLLGVQIVASTGVSWIGAGVLALPLVLFYSFVCLASWYPCRAMQPGKVSLAAIAATHALSALFSASVWIGVGIAWVRLLARIERFADLPAAFVEIRPLFFAAGIFLYLLAASGHYLLATFQASREAESRNLELQVRTREAELEAVKAKREQELAEQELELARSIQRRLLPPPELDGDGFRVAARNLPAQFVAGDFYDAFALPDGSLAVVVADVAGKGVGASLIMASVKAILPLVASHNSVTETLRLLNGKLVEELAPREFVALCLARYDPGTRRLEIANAGLPDPYWLRDGEAPRALVVPGERLPLGARPSTTYESLGLALAPGQSLLMLTDGLPEAPTASGEPLGYAVMESLFDHPVAVPTDWLGLLLDKHRDVTAPGLQDDLTALLLQAC
jgi:serine phosphatase RsbU (regulator of sigma subunit)